MVIILPKNNQDILNIKKYRSPTDTYKLNIKKEEIFDNVSGQDALKQAIYKILNTERYGYNIYSWNYGVSLNDLLGKDIIYIMSEVKVRINEALMQDDRILNVYDFVFKAGKNELLVTFNVETIYGHIETEKVVNI